MVAILLPLAFAIAAPAAADKASPVEPAPEPGFEYRVQGKVLWVTAPAGHSYQIELPCSGVATAVHAARLFVACGDDGVAVLSLEAPSTPQLIGVRDLGGTVVGFHEAGGALWAEMVRREARLVGEPVSPTPEGTVGTAPVAGTPGGAPPSPGLPAPGVANSETEPSHETRVPGQPPTERAGQGPALAPPHMVAMGEVVGIRGSRAVVTLGRATGLAPGERVGFYALRKVPLGGGQVATSEEILAVGVARVVADERAEVELGTDELVPIGASARRTSAPVTADRWLPPRPAGVWELAFTLRPFLAIGAFGVGTVSDASVGVRLPSVHLAAVFEPLAVALANDGNVFSAAGNVFASYDTRYFEVGLGAGWSAVNNEDPIYNYDESTGRPLPGLGLVDGGFSLGQVVRLGAVDGLHLAARNTFVLYRSEFHYGSTVAELMVPATDRAWVFARGGGGSAAGFAYGELGLRMLLSGNGGPQSVFASASLGGANVWGKKEVNCGGPGEQIPCYDEDSYPGPLVGFGLEWRP